jgi:hypothetical protein
VVQLAPYQNERVEGAIPHLPFHSTILKHHELVKRPFGAASPRGAAVVGRDKGCAEQRGRESYNKLVRDDFVLYLEEIGDGALCVKFADCLGA